MLHFVSKINFFLVPRSTGLACQASLGGLGSIKLLVRIKQVNPGPLDNWGSRFTRKWILVRFASPPESNRVPRTVLVWMHPQETFGPGQRRPATTVSFFFPCDFLLRRAQLILLLLPRLFRHNLRFQLLTHAETSGVSFHASTFRSWFCSLQEVWGSAPVSVSLPLPLRTQPVWSLENFIACSVCYFGPESPRS